MEQENGGYSLTKDERFARMVGLSNQYGSSRNIPDNELAEIGYVRSISPDGSVSLLPVERQNELAERKIEREMGKLRERPFEIIQVNLPTAERSFRFIPKDQYLLYRNQLNKVEAALNYNWIDDSQNIDLGLPSEYDNFVTFYSDYMQFCEEQDFSRIFPQSISTAVTFSLPQRGLYEDQPNIINSFDIDQYLSQFSREKGISSAESREIFNDLTRVDGYHNDVPELQRIRAEKIKRQLFMLEVGDKSYDDELQEMNALREKGIETNEDFLRFILPTYLHHAQLPQLAEVIRNKEDWGTFDEKMNAFDAQDPWKDEEKGIKASLRDGSEEERVSLNARLKEIKEQRKKRLKIKQGVIDFFLFADVYARAGKRAIKEAQDFLTAGKNTKEGQAMFYLDARDNEELDRDPGSISGDCTSGKPLPFNRADIPAFNIKVFTSEKRHSGNMYLIATVVNESERKVWHLDAIQIPLSGVDWESSIEEIIKSLSSEAETKGIEAITVNRALHHISNYDFIANAVKTYWEEHGRMITYVDMPENIPDGYSSFQGTGDAIVLWSKNNDFEHYEGELEVNEQFFNPNGEPLEW